jgi:disulfide bond formation protein DsbB
VTTDVDHWSKRVPWPRVAWASAFLVAAVATVGSLAFSGIGPLNWAGMRLFPCELCWYQRILMYPLPVIILAGLLAGIPRLHALVLPFSVPGALVAAYHVFLQSNPAAGAGQCFVGSCTAVMWTAPGGFTIPQLSLLAFAVVTALAVVAAVARE